MKLGLIGLGNMGRMYVRLAGQNPAVELVSVCDASRERLEQAVQEHPGAHPYTDFDEMFQREKLKAVGIMTPDTSHLAPALAASRAGCHMLIEKPLAMNEAEARQIVAAVREAGVFCQVAYTNRWNPPYVAARELIRSGKLGEVTSLNARINNTLFTPTKMLSWAAESSLGR